MRGRTQSWPKQVVTRIIDVRFESRDGDMVSAARPPRGGNSERRGWGYRVDLLALKGLVL